MNATERLLSAIVDLQHYITHDVDPDKCAACPRWDELQSAAMAMVAEVDALRADAERYRWLRSAMDEDIAVVQGFGVVSSSGIGVAATYEEALFFDKLDAALDAVRGGEG